LPDEYKTKGIIAEISEQLRKFASEASGMVVSNYQARSNLLVSLDRDYVAPRNGMPVYQFRWSLYTNACALASARIAPEESDVGSSWKRFSALNSLAEEFGANLKAYNGPLAPEVSAVCNSIAADAVKRLREKYIQDYAALVKTNLQQLAGRRWTPETVTNAGSWLVRVDTDLGSARGAGVAAPIITDLGQTLQEARAAILNSINAQLAERVGFPVRRASKQSMDLAALADLRKLLRELTRELQAKVWQSADNAALEQLRASCAKYAGVMNALLKENGEPVEWELRFVPSEQQADRDIILVYRYANFSIANQPAEWEELTRASAPLLLGKGNSSSGIKIAFKKLSSDTAELVPVETKSWGLVELLKLTGAERLDEGARWRIKVRLEGAGGSSPGNVNLEAAPKAPLPKLDDWPE